MSDIEVLDGFLKTNDNHIDLIFTGNKFSRTYNWECEMDSSAVMYFTNDTIGSSFEWSSNLEYCNDKIKFDVLNTTNPYYAIENEDVYSERLEFIKGIGVKF